MDLFIHGRNFGYSDPNRPNPRCLDWKTFCYFSWHQSYLFHSPFRTFTFYWLFLILRIFFYSIETQTNTVTLNKFVFKIESLWCTCSKKSACVYSRICSSSCSEVFTYLKWKYICEVKTSIIQACSHKVTRVTEIDYYPYFRTNKYHTRSKRSNVQVFLLPEDFKRF